MSTTRQPRSLSADQIATFSAIASCVRANGGSTRLTETDPRTFIRRGLVYVVAAGSRHMPTRYGLTSAGETMARDLEAARKAHRKAGRERDHGT